MEALIEKEREREKEQGRHAIKEICCFMCKNDNKDVTGSSSVMQFKVSEPAQHVS